MTKKWKFFSKKGHTKIRSAKFLSVPPNSAPTLGPCRLLPTHESGLLSAYQFAWCTLG